jgi:hypothetical protein
VWSSLGHTASNGLVSVTYELEETHCNGGGFCCASPPPPGGAGAAGAGRGGAPARGGRQGLSEDEAVARVERQRQHGGVQRLREVAVERHGEVGLVGAGDTCGAKVTGFWAQTLGQL